jgi:hypothetical protein
MRCDQRRRSQERAEAKFYATGEIYPCLHPCVLDVVSAAEDDPPDPLFSEGCNRMIAPQMLEGYLDKPLVTIGPEGVAAVAHRGAQHRTHRGFSLLYGPYCHRLLHRGGYPSPLQRSSLASCSEERITQMSDIWNIFQASFGGHTLHAVVCEC